MAYGRDRIADRFKDTEARLNAWGDACRQNAKALGLPTLSGIARMIEHVKREDRQARGVRKSKLRQARRAWKRREGSYDAKGIATDLKYVEADKTAQGKQKGDFRRRSLQLSGTVAQTDEVVSKLPNWAKKCIFRSYMYGQPDRKAAEELRMPSADYTQRRRAAVEQVANRLAQRYDSCVMPSRRRTFREV